MVVPWCSSSHYSRLELFPAITISNLARTLNDGLPKSYPGKIRKKTSTSISERLPKLSCKKAPVHPKIHSIFDNLLDGGAKPKNNDTNMTKDRKLGILLLVWQKTEPWNKPCFTMTRLRTERSGLTMQPLTDLRRCSPLRLP